MQLVHLAFVGRNFSHERIHSLYIEYRGLSLESMIAASSQILTRLQNFYVNFSNNF